MKREEVKQILGEGATEEQISAVLNMYHSQKTELDKANSEISKYKNSYEEAVKESNSYKSELDKINEANLTKEEQLAKREKEIAEKEKQTNLIHNKAMVKEKLAGLNLDAETLNSLVDTIATSDMEKSLSSADVYVNTFNSMKESTIKSTKEELITLDVKPPASNNPNNDAMTWDKFRTLSVEEQNKFQQEHPEEFKNL